MAIASEATSSRVVNQPLAVCAVERPGPRFLEDVADQLLTAEREEQVRRAMDHLFLGLERLRRDMSPEQWAAYVEQCRGHRLRQLIHEDPFTRRAFVKPRGYAGDARMLDYIYSIEEQWAPPDATPLGHHIFRYTTGAPASEGVRSRRAFVAGMIDRLAADRPQLEILSIAAGHLREANLAMAVKRRRFARFVALDADHDSLREVERAYGAHGVTTLHANVRRLITRKVSLGSFDLIYCTGLYDYMGPAAGRRLLAVMFDMLHSGGRLVVANFLPGIRDRGYMEAYMDWHLIYRSRQDMIDLTAEIPQHEIREIRLNAEENQNILFIEVSKR